MTTTRSYTVSTNIVNFTAANGDKIEVVKETYWTIYQNGNRLMTIDRMDTLIAVLANLGVTLFDEVTP